jgi:hypothetical protein
MAETKHFWRSGNRFPRGLLPATKKMRCSFYIASRRRHPESAFDKLPGAMKKRTDGCLMQK